MTAKSVSKTKAPASATTYTAPLSKTIPAAKTEAETAGGTWNDNATVTGQWSTNEEKNSWMWINDNNNPPNSGWKKLSDASDSGNVALTMLATHAKQVGSNVKYRAEDDGMVHEMYVW